MTVADFMSSNLYMSGIVQIPPAGIRQRAWQDEAKRLNIATISRIQHSRTVQHCSRQCQKLAVVTHPRHLACRLENSSEMSRTAGVWTIDCLSCSH